MKKIIALCAIMSVATVFADEISFGCLRVDSSAAETIVSIPWIGAGVSGGAIKVADIVKTTNLNEGDELWWYDPTNKKYWFWELNSEGKWVSQDQTSENGEVEQSESSAIQSLNRGNAILLIRKAPQGGSIASCFYIYGQAATLADGEKTITIGNGTIGGAPCYTLIAPPSVEDTGINDIIWSNVGGHDQIIIDGVAKILEYNNNGWGNYVTNKDTWEDVWVQSTAKIKAGQGAWYISKGGANAPTATWPTKGN